MYEISGVLLIESESEEAWIHQCQYIWQNGVVYRDAKKYS